MDTSFDKSVFVNCPFDKEYTKLKNPLIFTILYLGYTPRLSTERANSGESRISKILGLIESSKFGIHDLSRIKATKKGAIARFNMPYELGLDYGCRHYHNDSKILLVLETEEHRYKAAISDITSSDIEAHNDDPRTIVGKVRDFLVGEGDDGDIDNAPSINEIWNNYNDFNAALYDELIKRDFTKDEIDNLQLKELLTKMRKWIDSNVMQAS
jgi:hypothetical protein